MTPLHFIALAALLAEFSHAKCIPGSSLFLPSTNPSLYAAVARDSFRYTGELGDIKLSSKPQINAPHRLFLYSGFWLGTEDWCYETETNAIRLTGKLRHSVSGAEVPQGQQVWIGYASPEDDRPDCIKGNILSTLPGRAWNQDPVYDVGGQKYEELHEWFQYSPEVSSLSLKSQPAPGILLDVNTTVAGLPVGTYYLDWCYNPSARSVRLLNQPLRKLGYARIPATALDVGEGFFVKLSEKR